MCRPRKIPSHAGFELRIFALEADALTTRTTRQWSTRENGARFLGLLLSGRTSTNDAVSSIRDNNTTTTNNNRIERRNSRFLTISSLRRELTPTRTQSCPNHVRLSRARRRATCHVKRRDSSAVKFDWVEIAFILGYFIGWTIQPMKVGRKPEYPEKTTGDELQKMRCIPMVYTHGVYLWCENAVYTYGVYPWCIPMVYTYAVHLWCIPIAYTYGVCLWCIPKVYTQVYTYGIYLWCIPKVYTYGIYQWCTPMVYTHGAYLWCIPIVYTHGVYPLCIPMVYTHGVYLWCIPTRHGRRWPDWERQPEAAKPQTARATVLWTKWTCTY